MTIMVPASPRQQVAAWSRFISFCFSVQPGAGDAGFDLNSLLAK